MTKTAGIPSREVHHDLYQYTVDFFTRPGDGFSGTKDLIETAIAGFEIAKCFNFQGIFSTRACDSLGILSQGFSIPALFHDANDLRHHLVTWGKSDNWEVNLDVFNSTARTAKNASETFGFFDAMNIIYLKNWLNVTRGVFWGALFSLDFVDYFVNIANAESYMKKIQKAKDPEVKAFYEHKLDFTFLKIIQNVSTIALASLMLVSIFFVGIAEGFLFAPVTLGLTSTWLVLNIFTHYYEQILNTKEGAFPLGTLSKV